MAGCISMGDTTDPDNTIHTVASIIGSFLGTAGALIVIISNVSSPVKAMSKRIIICISIADILQSLPTFLVACYHQEQHITEDWMDKSKNLCKWQSLVITTAAELTFLWTLGLSQHMYLLVKFGMRVARKAYIMLYILSVIPLAINIVAFRYDILGSDEFTNNKTQHHHMTSWCWLNVTNQSFHDPNHWRRPCPAALWNGKGFEIACYVGTLIYSVLTRRELHKLSGYDPIEGTGEHEEEEGGEDHMRNITGASARVNRILFIPLFLIAIRIWGTTIRLACYCSDPIPTSSSHTSICSNGFLLFMENLCDPLQGFANCILYKFALDGNLCGECSCFTRLRSRFRNRRTQQARHSYDPPETIWVPAQTSLSYDSYFN